MTGGNSWNWRGYNKTATMRNIEQVRQAVARTCRTARYDHGGTLAKLAHQAGVNINSLSALENGRPVMLETSLRYVAVIGAMLRATREEMGLSAGDVAQRLGVTAQIIGELERGELLSPRLLSELNTALLKEARARNAAAGLEEEPVRRRAGRPPQPREELA